MIPKRKWAWFSQVKMWFWLSIFHGVSELGKCCHLYTYFFWLWSEVVHLCSGFKRREPIRLVTLLNLRLSLTNFFYTISSHFKFFNNSFDCNFVIASNQYTNFSQHVFTGWDSWPMWFFFNSYPIFFLNAALNDYTLSTERGIQLQLLP